MILLFRMRNMTIHLRPQSLATVMAIMATRMPDINTQRPLRKSTVILMTMGTVMATHMVAVINMSIDV